jgi:NAD(P)-dependent dehydrogenase (short-subunit alcohol dehydrogenase family)
MERFLEGRTAIVTGGMRGIGLGIARKLHHRGAKVAVWDYDAAGWEGGLHPAMVLLEGEFAEVESIYTYIELSLTVSPIGAIITQIAFQFSPSHMRLLSFSAYKLNIYGLIPFSYLYQNSWR